MPKRPPNADRAAVNALLDAVPEPARARLRALADVIRAGAPKAVR